MCVSVNLSGLETTVELLYVPSEYSKEVYVAIREQLYYSTIFIIFTTALVVMTNMVTVLDQTSVRVSTTTGA